MTELSARAFFRYDVPIGRRPAGLRVDGSLAEWGDDGLLPDLGQMEGREAFAEQNGGIYCDWALVAEGLALLADKKSPRYIQDKMNSYLDPSIHFNIDKMRK